MLELLSLASMLKSLMYPYYQVDSSSEYSRHEVKRRYIVFLLSYHERDQLPRSWAFWVEFVAI